MTCAPERFVLDARLAKDTVVVGDQPLSRLLMMNDSRWPWFILVPRRADLVELTDLPATDRATLIEEAAAVAAFLQAHGKPDKINVGALGNIVRQLHLHVVARVVGDPAWPGPVWGQGIAAPYQDENARAMIDAARSRLNLKAAGA